MEDQRTTNIIIHVFLSVITVLFISVLYLIYQNRMAEDMLREMNRDYTDLVREYEKKYGE